MAGRFICVEADGEKSAASFRRYFEGWHVTRLDARPNAPTDATITVRTGETAPPPPRGFDSFDVAEGGVCYTDGGTYFFASGDSAVRVADVQDAPARVEVWIGGGASRGGAPLARLIFNAATAAMRRCGLFELHGAGVVEPGGVGVLFVGPSGSGKSTLATQLARAGWRYLSDDTLLITGDGGESVARPLRRVFAVTGTTVAAGLLAGFEDVLDEPAPFDPEKKRFEPERVFTGGLAESCRPRALFFPTVAHAPESRARRLSKSETMARLIRMCPWACYDRAAARSHLAALTLLARQADGFELRAGTDLLRDAGFASRFVSSTAGGEL